MLATDEIHDLHGLIFLCATGLLDITGIHSIINHVFHLGYSVLGARLKALGNYLSVGLFVRMRRFFPLSDDMYGYSCPCGYQRKGTNHSYPKRA